MNDLCEHDVHAHDALGLELQITSFFLNEGKCRLIAFVILLIRIVGIYLFFKISNPLSIDYSSNWHGDKE
mgnify:FL=1